MDSHLNPHDLEGRDDADQVLPFVAPGHPRLDAHQHGDTGTDRSDGSILRFQERVAGHVVRGGPRLVLACTTWNTVDLVELFLTHYERIGFDHAFIMDYESTDGTRDVLDSARWRSFVTRVPFPGLAASIDTSNLLLEAVRTASLAATWAFFCDPDELLVTPNMVFDLESLEGFDDDVSQVTVRRFNVTGLRSVARNEQTRLTPRDALTLRIMRRADRVPERDVLAATLDPAWIYTSIPGKVLVRADSTQSLGPGCHSAASEAGRNLTAPGTTHLLHYPLRTFDEFARKVAMNAADFQANPDYPVWWGWQARRWVRIAETGSLYDEYLQQFVPDDELPQMIADGTIQDERRVLTMHTTERRWARAA